MFTWRGILEKRLSENKSNWKRCVPLSHIPHSFLSSLPPFLPLAWDLTWPSWLKLPVDPTLAFVSSYFYEPPHSAYTVLTFSSWNCCPLFSLSITVFPNNSLLLLICIHLTGDTTESAFLPRSKALHSITYPQEPKVLSAVFSSRVLSWLSSHDYCSCLILQISPSSPLN